MTTSPRTVMRIHFHLQSADLYEQLLTVLEGITPRVQPHPADLSADVDLTGALRYWDRDPEGLAAVIRLRALALYGVQSSAGVGPSRMIAAMAAAITPPGAATIIGNTPYDVAAFLRPQRASALPGVGPATARTLTRYGIDTVGDIADTPLATLQRILGIAAGRQAHDRAHGTDDRPVIPAAAPKTITRTRRFDRDELEPDQHHRTVLGLAEQLGSQLRDTDAVCQALTLTVTYADRTSTSRTRTLAEPTAHTPALADTGRELLTGLGLQRARVQAISLRAERLQPAEHAPRQLTLDPCDDNARSLEAALDRARTRFGTCIAGSAAAYRTR
ncbi:helix-hairpin-helix domain-containing protein [Streptomyces sp. ME01-18a]|uniref:DNA polymerase Y family protein n=1 Tax=Streptomyces sp. ME01-18a TaxID=3028669 RepID=UPI0029BEA65B|nr:helix-hairpin-helix domain-containing protein [Streptomyces sp. ME01-18a]MDX3433911.1 helix-hairpin-helix domain-containing protein [Streptomyces sp. ME01-18a]